MTSSAATSNASDASDATTAPNIEISGLSHRYKEGDAVLSDVNLSFGTGLFGLLGPNGAGKSTLMRILCTLLEPSEGVVRVGGHDVTLERRKVRELIGYLPQDFGGWRLHRVDEVLDTLARLSGMTDKRHRRERIEAVLHQVGLDEVAHQKVKKLSGGMVRRLGVAQALVHEPQILVVDEPTVGLDPEERVRFRHLMAEIGTSRTILLSTHIVADLGAACREIALLDAGSIVFEGAPSQLISKARRKVFAITTSAEQAEALEARYEIVSRTTGNDGVTLRGITGDAPPPGATMVEEPSLEESYMAFMVVRGRGEAARTESAEGDD